MDTDMDALYVEQSTSKWIDETTSDDLNQISMANQWIHHITREDMSKEELLNSYKQWVSNYEAVRLD